MSITTTVAQGVSAVVLAAALMATGAGAATAAPTESTCTFAQHVVSVYQAVPVELRTDLRDARSMSPGADRVKALKTIKADALAGEYGEVTQARVEAFGLYRAANGPLPEDLKADLTELRGTDGRAAKVALAEQIADQALDGEYGTSVQNAAEKIQQSEAWQSCDATR